MRTFKLWLLTILFFSVSCLGICTLLWGIELAFEMDIPGIVFFVMGFPIGPLTLLFHEWVDEKI